MVVAVTEKYLQESYSVVAHAIQLDWVFLHHVTKNMGHEFEGLEKVLRETFLPNIFFGRLITLPPVVGSLSTLPVENPV